MSKKLPYQRFCLANGLTVILYPMNSVWSGFAVIYVRVGAVYEKQNERGISHFTEHVALLGTKKYPSSLKISQVEENLGARFDGTTDRFSTQYWIRFPSVNIKEGLDLLYQLAFEPLLDEKDVLKERNVVLSEYNDFWHNPEKRFEHEIWQRRFKQKGHPYSWRSLGFPQTIKTLNKEKVLAWRNQYYHPANMVLSIAGNLDSKEVENLVENNFGNKKAETRAIEPKFNPNDYSSFTFCHYPENRPQIRFIITFPVFGWKQVSRRKRFAVRLLSHIFGGGPASRIFQRLREKERFVYRAGSDFYLHPWLGDFEIWGSLPVEKLVLAMKAVKEEIGRLVDEGVSEQEMKTAKNYLNARTLMKFDNPESIAYYFGSQEFNEEEIWLPERYIEEGEKITKGELGALAKEIFDYSKTNVGLLGKVSTVTLKEIEKVFKK